MLSRRGRGPRPKEVKLSMVRALRDPRPLALSFLLPVLLTACTADGDSAPPLEPGGVRGELVVHVLDFGDHSELRHALRLPSGEQRPLRFVEPPPLASGTALEVWGGDDGDTFTVARFAVLEAPPVQRRAGALVSGQKKPTKRWAFVLVDTGSGVNITKEAAERKLFSDMPDSIRSYYREASFGVQELEGEVLGPFKYTGNPTGGLCNNFADVVRGVGTMVPSGFNQYLWYLGSPIRNCDWGGVAQLGTAAQPTRHSFYNGNAECVVLIQEPGHNFGMVHSSSLRCSKNGTPVSMIDPNDTQSQCAHDEYGNPFDPMGGGAGNTQSLSRCFHMNGVQKAYEDWLGGCNIVKAMGSGTYTIFPLEKPCNGVQLLQIPLPVTRVLPFPPSSISTLTRGIISSYYVELRAPVGLDTSLQSPRVFVLAASNLNEARDRGNPNWLIDTTPETRSVLDAALGVGKTFSDPVANGPKITLVSADATKAVIRVQMTGGGDPDQPGTGVCSDDTPFKAPGPETCLAAPLSSDGGAGGSGGADAGRVDGGTGGPGGSGGSLPDAAPVTVDASPDLLVLPPGGFLPGTRNDAAPVTTGAGGSAPAAGGGQASSAACGCRLAGSSDPAPSAPLVLAVLALLRARARARARARTSSR
jgi:hypothetical protein